MVTATKDRTVAVFGAAGYTGVHVISELLRRGIKPIAIGRKAEALEAAHRDKPEVEIKVATVDNDEQLDAAISGAQVVSKLCRTGCQNRRASRESCSSCQCALYRCGSRTNNHLRFV